jgi:hypothetical protein
MDEDEPAEDEEAEAGGEGSIDSADFVSGMRAGGVAAGVGFLVWSLLTSSGRPAGARRRRVQRRRGPKAGAPSPSRLAPGVGRASRRAEAVAASAGGAGAAPPRGPRCVRVVDGESEEEFQLLCV